MRNVLTLAGILAVLGLVAMGVWFMPGGSRHDEPAQGLVVVAAPTVTPTPALPPMPVVNLPAAPDKVMARVRQDYPLLRDVDFRCDTAGCAVTATIPPPTGDEFLQKRQEMLTGGLARTIEANGYKTTGPVEMKEVAFNTFQIRAAIAQVQGR